eukprot:g23986.t1
MGSAWKKGGPLGSSHAQRDLIKNVTKIIEKRIERGQILISCVENWQADVLTYYFQVDNTYTCEALHGLCLGPIKEKILKMLAGKKIRILCGSKQLNEGLDLPGVATVIVCDADSAGFLRTDKDLRQLAGRAARRADGKVYLLVTKKDNEKIAPGTNPETFPDRKKMDRKKMEKWTLRHYINFLALPWGRLKECLPSKKGLEDNAFKNNDLIRNMQKLLLMCLFDGIAWDAWPHVAGAGNLLDEGKKTFRDIVHMPLSEILKTANVGPKSGQRLHRLAEDDKHKKNLLNVEKAYRIVLSDAKFTRSLVQLLQTAFRGDLRETLKSLNVTSRSSLATKVKSVVEDLKGLENTIVVEAVARLIWLADADVLCISMHLNQSDLHFFPFLKGKVEERGRGAGEGFTLNLPLPEGAGDAFSPEVLFLALGFDGLEGDPCLAGLCLSSSFFQRVVRRCCHLCQRVVCTLQGGYQPEATAEALSSVLDGPPPSETLFVTGLPMDVTQEFTKDIFSQYGSVKEVTVLPVAAGKTAAAAFVILHTVDDAKWIVEHVNGNVPQNLTDPVTVVFATPRDSRPGGKGKGPKGGMMNMMNMMMNSWGGWGGKGGKDGKDGKANGGKPHNYKTVMCKFFETQGWCQRVHRWHKGSACRQDYLVVS